MPTPKLDPAELDAVAKTVRSSLAQHTYYTQITINGNPVMLAKPGVFHAAYEDGSLILSFSAFMIQRFAPLWTFPKDSDLKTSDEGFGRCKRKVVSRGSKEILAENQAMLTSLFFNDPSGTSYSQLASTWLEVRCQKTTVWSIMKISMGLASSGEILE